jgi:uncharacterized Zn-finger protein
MANEMVNQAEVQFSVLIQCVRMVIYIHFTTDSTLKECREIGFEKPLNLADTIPNNFSAILPTLLNLQLYILTGKELPRVCLAKKFHNIHQESNTPSAIQAVRCKMASREKSRCSEQVTIQHNQQSKVTNAESSCEKGKVPLSESLKLVEIEMLEKDLSEFIHLVHVAKRPAVKEVIQRDIERTVH